MYSKFELDLQDSCPLRSALMSVLALWALQIAHLGMEKQLRAQVGIPSSPQVVFILLRNGLLQFAVMQIWA